MIGITVAEYLELGPRRQELDDWLELEGLIDQHCTEIRLLDETGCTLELTCEVWPARASSPTRAELELEKRAVVTGTPFPIHLIGP